MRIVAQVAAAVQAVFGTSIDDLARATRCVQRQRKFSGTSLARTLVLTVLLRPAAKNRDYRAMAAKAGVHVTEEAIDHRFTDELVLFLKGILQQAVSQTLAGKDSAAPLLQQGVADLEGSSGVVSCPLANRTLVQAVEVAQSRGRVGTGRLAATSDGGAVCETDWSDRATLDSLERRVERRSA